MSTVRKSYTEEFKREAVRLAGERGNIAQTARDLGISDTTLQNWKRQLEQQPEQPFPGHGNPRDPETARLEREVRRLKEENEILKKAVGIFTVRPQ
jgi:transposase